MTNTISFDMQEQGYLARRTDLMARGRSAKSIDSALREGTLLRPVKGWVATRDARQDAVIAVLNRGALTGASALRTYGIWAGTDTHLHVRVPPNVPNTRARALHPISAFAPTGASGEVRHWTRTEFHSMQSWRVSVGDALVAFAREESAEFSVAAIESALYSSTLSPRDLPFLWDHLPRSLGAYRPVVDGRAEAGTETLARLRLGFTARRIDIQVRVGPHRLDILIDGWLNVEIDSEEWHGRERLANSRRDTWLVARGYVVLRFDYHEVMYEWEACAAAVAATLRDPRRA